MGKKADIFSKWIRTTGVDTIAKRLKVSPRTVDNWQRDAVYPRVEQMKSIRRWTKGLVDYHHMIER